MKKVILLLSLLIAAPACTMQQIVIPANELTGRPLIVHGLLSISQLNILYMLYKQHCLFSAQMPAFIMPTQYEILSFPPKITLLTTAYFSPLLTGQHCFSYFAGNEILINPYLKYVGIFSSIFSAISILALAYDDNLISLKEKDAQFCQADIVKKNQELRADHVCPICHDIAQDPINPCALNMHVYCSDCLKYLVTYTHQKNPTHILRCSLCMQPFSSDKIEILFTEKRPSLPDIWYTLLRNYSAIFLYLMVHMYLAINHF